MKRSLCALPLLLAAPAFCADDPALLGLLPPQTQIVIGLHVKAILDSGLAQSLTPELQNAHPDWQQILALVGFDPLHDVDEVLLASSGDAKQPQALVVAHGAFALARAALHGESYHDVTLASGNTNGDGVYTFLDDQTALAGDTALVKAAIDRRGLPAGLPEELASRIAQYRQHYEIWGIVNRTAVLTSYLPSSGQAAGLDGIDRVQFGIGLTHGLELKADVHARTPKDAEQLAAALQFFEGIARASQPAASAGTQFNVKNAGGTLQISLAVSETDLRRAIEQQRKNGMWQLTNPPNQPPAPAQFHAAAEQRAMPRSVPSTDPPTTGGTAVFTLPGRQ